MLVIQVFGEKAKIYIKAKSYIESQKSNDLDINIIINELRISKSSLNRLFIQAMGKSPIQYHREIRHDGAASLLHDPWLSVKEICWKLGFNDPFSFSRAFKKQFGLSPMQFRKAIRITELGKALQNR